MIDTRIKSEKDISSRLEKKSNTCVHPYRLVLLAGTLQTVTQAHRPMFCSRYSRKFVVVTFMSKASKLHSLGLSVCFLLCHSAKIKVLWNMKGSSCTAGPAKRRAVFISSQQTHWLRHSGCKCTVFTLIPRVIWAVHPTYCKNQDFPLIPLCSARQFILYLPRSFHWDVKSWSSWAHNPSWISPRQMKDPFYTSKWHFSYRVSYWSQSLPTFSASKPFPTHLSDAHPALYPRGGLCCSGGKVKAGSSKEQSLRGQCAHPWKKSFSRHLLSGQRGW